MTASLVILLIAGCEHAMHESKVICGKLLIGGAIPDRQHCH